MRGGLRGTSGAGTERRKLPEMPEEVLSFSPCERRWPDVELEKRIKRARRRVVHRVADTRRRRQSASSAGDARDPETLELNDTL